jgi:hypothetical protein
MEQKIAELGSRWETEGLPQRVGEDTELYMVKSAVWKEAGMEPDGGVLCIGCLEARIGRRLRRKDFLPDHPFNDPRLPGTDRRFERLVGDYP